MISSMMSSSMTWVLLFLMDPFVIKANNQEGYIQFMIQSKAANTLGQFALMDKLQITQEILKSFLGKLRAILFKNCKHYNEIISPILLLWIRLTRHSLIEKMFLEDIREAVFDDATEMEAACLMKVLAKLELEMLWYSMDSLLLWTI